MSRLSDAAGRPGKLIVALAGNPNAGKTSVFNRLTGATQSVGNYPGVTVEQKVGKVSHGGYELSIVDLPGTYSLTAYSLEEVIARNFIVDSSPGAVVDVVDASNLERNLYLMVQLMEMRCPLVIALNMVDKAKRRGLTIDTDRMAALLGVPVVATVGNRGIGTGELLDAIVAMSRAPGQGRPRPVSYGHEVENEILKLAAVIET
ncbi:MAG: 50S ribosome-binding GTPase, partial [Phycisphaerae bacterium]|nr:50S ribosome-binding GTPase [Phycisphaerae bacterium]